MDGLAPLNLELMSAPTVKLLAIYGNFYPTTQGFDSW